MGRFSILFCEIYKQGIQGCVAGTPHLCYSGMAPSSDDNVKNIGAVHLTSMVVLLNPRSYGMGPMSIALDLHLLLEPLEPEGDAIEKIILARLYNQTKISFVDPRMCFVSFCVHPTSISCSVPL